MHLDGVLSRGLWFENVVQRETLYVQSKYNSNFTLLEACGGIGTEPDGLAPSACGRSGVMKGIEDISFVRLVFAPKMRTSPSLLAMINITSNHTTYEYSEDSWIGDNEAVTDWDSSISLEAAHDIYSRVNGSGFNSFVWRAMMYPCVYEPVFVFMPVEEGENMVFVGAYTARACRTATMIENATLHCHPDCYD